MYLYTLPGLPEIVDIGQAMALDFQAIGLKPKLVEIDFPRVREQYRTKTIHGALCVLRAMPSVPWNAIRIFNKAKDSVVYAYEHPFIEERLEDLGQVVDPAERARLLREIGDHKFNEFAEMPLFWLFAEAAVNPKYHRRVCVPGGDHRLLHPPGVHQAVASACKSRSRLDGGERREVDAALHLETVSAQSAGHLGA